MILIGRGPFIKNHLSVINSALPQDPRTAPKGAFIKNFFKKKSETKKKKNTFIQFFSFIIYLFWYKTIEVIRSSTRR